MLAHSLCQFNEREFASIVQSMRSEIERLTKCLAVDLHFWVTFENQRTWFDLAFAAAQT